MAEAAGKVVVVVGDVTAESTSGTRSLSVESPVFENDTLVTDQGERIEVLFSDGTRLSQGENSKLNIDSYIFDPNAPDNSDILLNAVQGTYRTITGKIAEDNPDNFTIKTPLATLGIRGTTVLSHITPEHEIHGPEYIEEGKAFVLTDNFGNTRFITDYKPVKVIDIYKDEPAGFQRILTEDELLFFDEQVPISPEAREESSETGAEGAAVAKPFGPDSDDAKTEPYLASTPNLFGPDGLPPLGEAAAQYPYPPYLVDDPQHPYIIQPTSTHEDSDIFYGYIEDTSNTNQPPRADDMFFSVAEDHTLNSFLIGSDPDGDSLTFINLGPAQNGSVVVNPDGSFQYRPNPNFFGDDSFVFQVEDEYGATATAIVSIRVTPVNDPPVAGDETFNTPVNIPVNNQLNAFDVDGDPLTFSIALIPVNGNVTINADGTFTYTPNPGFTGSDTFQFSVSDGHGGFDLGTITVVVGGPPGPGSPVAVNANFVAIQGINFNDQAQASDPDGDPLTFSIVTQPTFGSVTLNPDGTFTYTTTNNPLEENYGTDTFQFLVEDGQGGTDVGTITMTVAANYIGDANANAPKAGTPLDDTFTGMGGPDTFTGGPGSDTYIYINGTSAAEGGDIIIDFQSGEDVLQIGGTGLNAGGIFTSTGSGSYGGALGGPTGSPAIVIHHNTGVGAYEVWFDPSVNSPTGNEVLIATLTGNSTIDSGDINLV